MFLAENALLSASQSEITAQVAHHFYDDLTRGDVTAALDRLADDVEWRLPVNGYSRIIPYLGNRQGRSQVAEALRIHAEVVTIKEFKIRSLTCEDNRGTAVVYAQGICNQTGREFEFEEVHALVVGEDGKIARWTAYFDPTPLVEAFRANLSQQLIKAVQNNDVEESKRILLNGADANTRDAETGLTVLMMAACQASTDLVALLLDRGADPLTADTKTGATALHKACQSGNTDVARLLVEQGAFVDAVTPTMGHTPIMDALWYRWPELVAFLVSKNANLNLSTHYGFSMMERFQFELSENTQGKDKLLEIDGIFKRRQKANQQQIEAQKVMAATSKGDSDAVQKLIQQGADVNTTYPIINSFLDGHTPLLVAARDGHKEIVRDLLRAGASVRVQDCVFKGAPIHKATYNGEPEILKLLLAQPDIDIDVQSPINGYTPIHDALWHGYTECAELLLEAGARLDLRGHDGKTPLDVALDVYGPDAKLVRRIRARQANKS